MTSDESVLVAGGKTEDDVVIGNTYDKYGSKNPIVVWMMNGFTQALQSFVDAAHPKSIHEVGCGEGYWSSQWAEMGLDVQASDFSEQVIEIAKENARSRGVSTDIFEARSVYDLVPGRDSADLIVCCEVLEHVEDPKKALEVLQSIATKDIILSVPREPIWRILNCVRGKYVSDFGNTPGHINHWSSGGFIRLVLQYFDIVSVARPLPWTMVHCRKKP